MRKYFTLSAFLMVSLVFLSCQKEEVLDDPLLGEWQVVSIKGSDGVTIVWEELKADLVDLIPEYECMEFTCSANKNTVTVTYTGPNESTNSCDTPSLSIYTWASEGTNYTFIQGTNVVKYTVSFSNNDNRMQWTDQTDNSVTVWDRIVTE
ncbi:MAG: hypothetical protein ACPGVF_05130 [Flavobacteriaceae bacterium]